MSDEPVKPLEKTLQEAIAEGHWSWLKPHHEKGSLFIVHRPLSLLEAAIRIARDERAYVEEWLKGQNLARPTATEIESWEKAQDKLFEFVIVQPFVLAQEVLLN